MVKVISSYLSMVFNDKNINRQEKEVLLLLKSFDKDDINSVQVKIKTLIAYMDTTNSSCLCRTLKSLKAKGYLDIDTGIGKSASIYRFIKDYKIDYANIYGIESLTSNMINSDKLVNTNMLNGNEFMSTEMFNSNEFVSTDMTNDNEFVTTNMISGNEFVSTEMFNGNKLVGTNMTNNNEFVTTNTISGNEFVDTTKNDIYNNINKNKNNNNKNNNNKVYGNKEDNNYSNNSRNINSNNKSSINSVRGSCTSSHNHNYVNNSLEDVFINILKHWNHQNISSILQLDLRIRDSITSALRKYSFESIIKAISNYSEVYYSSYFYDIKWNLSSFLTSQKGIDKFHDNGCMWQKYNENLYDENEEVEDVIIDKYSYIDV